MQSLDEAVMAKSDEATMKHRGHGSDAFGGTPVGRRVALPRGAREPITVFIDGVEQRRGEDYKISDGTIVFREPIYKEQLGDLELVPQARPRPRRLRLVRAQ